MADFWSTLDNHPHKCILTNAPDAEPPIYQQTRSSIILRAAVQYFHSNPDMAARLEAILLRQGPYSLRVVDWFVTNYIQHHSWRRGMTELHDDYRRLLTSYTKRFFDPFARRDRISVKIGCHPNSPHGSGPDIIVVTTVGQLNFFRWHLSSGSETALLACKSHVERLMAAGNKTAKNTKSTPSAQPEEEDWKRHSIDLEVRRFDGPVVLDLQ